MSGGESRMELISWINNLLQVNYTRVEQCGNGAVYCQIIDSIYRDVPLAKVKFASKLEYEFLTNFKVLQSAFNKHKIAQDIPVQRLIKSKFQDNLEFLQWMKKFWDAHYPGTPYDAVARRRGASGATEITAMNARSTPAQTRSQPTQQTTPLARSGVSSGQSTGARNSPIKTRTTLLGRRVSGANAASQVHQQRMDVAPAADHTGGENNNVNDLHHRELLTLQQQVEQQHQTINDLAASNQALDSDSKELRGAVEQLEKERGFYFEKLREIEIFIQQKQEDMELAIANQNQLLSEREGEDALGEEELRAAIEATTNAYAPLMDTLKEITAILYKTEEGFEIPDNETGEEIVPGEEIQGNPDDSMIQDTHETQYHAEHIETHEPHNMMMEENHLIQA